MERTIWVVFGSTGEYSDRSDWLVKAFDDENKAKELVEKADRKAKEIFAKRKSDDYNRYGKFDRDFGNEFDPQMEMDYTGTIYYYRPVILDENKL